MMIRAALHAKKFVPVSTTRRPSSKSTYGVHALPTARAQIMHSACTAVGLET
jgi:hypothetical protein